ncbi:unnamed protein product, partial [Aureobasidium pullulans]
MVLGDDVNGCYNYPQGRTEWDTDLDVALHPAQDCQETSVAALTAFQPGETCWRNDNDPECSNPLVEIACIS